MRDNMPQTDRHKNREIPIESDFYNTLDKMYYHYDFVWQYNYQDK